MTKYTWILSLALFLGACSNSENRTTAVNEVLDPNLHKGVALETINATNYTYVLVNENGKEKWLACPITEVKVGETYYFGNEMLMTNFVSKELGRTFSEVSFIEGLYNQPLAMNQQSTAQGNPSSGGQNPVAAPENAKPHQGSASVQVEKKAIKIEPVKGVTRIGDLISKMDSYKGKTVRVKGLVEKYSPGIMDRNWIHIQDGSEANGRFDLVVSTRDEVVVGEIVTLEGKVVLNKDFGAGYVYDLLIEEAKVKR